MGRIDSKSVHRGYVRRPIGSTVGRFNGRSDRGSTAGRIDGGENRRWVGSTVRSTADRIDGR